MPSTHFINRDFPDPDFPIITRDSPLVIFRFIFLRIFLLSKFFDKFKISIMLFILVTKKNCSNKII